MEPIVVEVRRSGIVEARHVVHAVAVKDGAVVAEAGDAAVTCFLRSSSKPIQALPLARARPDLDERDLAIASASHRATPDQIAAVRALLAKAPADEADLELGLQEGRPPEPVYNNCSGKHAGMLALCRAHGWPTEGYRLPEHPVQQACRTYTPKPPMSTRRAAHRDRRVRRRHVRNAPRAHGARLRPLRAAPGGQPGGNAMRAHPELVGGPDGHDFHLMRTAPGWFAKGGAEGLLCAGGTGFARRRTQVDRRRLPPARAGARRLPRTLSESTFPALAAAPIENTRGETVGEIVAIGRDSWTFLYEPVTAG